MFGLFSSKSKTQQTQTTNNNNYNTDNSSVDNSNHEYLDQSFVDNSDRSVTDIFTDNSNRSVTDIFSDNSNRSVTDIYQDSSQRTEQGWSGVLSGANVSGQVQITDGGAFGVASESLYAMGSVGTNALDNMQTLASDAVLSTTNLANNAISSTNDLASINASYMAGIAQDSLYTNANLFKALSSDILTSSSDSQNTVLDATRQALQFSDNASRSDGQQLAISTNKNMMMLIGVVGLAGVAVLVMGRK